jgi:hypothetical protein
MHYELQLPFPDRTTALHHQPAHPNRTMATDEQLKDFYCLHLSHAQRPNIETARHFAQYIDLFTNHCIHYRAWTRERANAVIADARALIATN